MRNAITNPYTYSYANCYAPKNSDTYAKSYAYTKGAPESAAATVVGTVEAGVSPA